MSTTSKTDYFDFIVEGRRSGAPWIATLGDFNHWGYWDDPRRARATLEEMMPSQQRLTDELLMMASLQDGQYVLDVGCGLGGTVRTIDELHQGLHLFGLDYDSRLVEITRAAVPGRGTNVVDVRQGNAVALPYADNTMDVVTAVECIFHFPGREAFMREALRVLKPGGRLVICDYLIAGVPESVKKRQRLLAKSPALKWLGSLDFITHQEYEYLSRVVGFAKLESRDVTRNTLPTYPNRVRFFKSTGLPMSVIGPRIAGMRLAELTSRIGIFRYVFYAFHKAAIKA